MLSILKLDLLSKFKNRRLQMKKLSIAMCLIFSGLILETAADPLFYGQSYGICSE